VSRTPRWLTRSWRFDRMAAVVHPVPARMSATFAAIAKQAVAAWRLWDGENCLQRPACSTLIGHDGVFARLPPQPAPQEQRLAVLPFVAGPVEGARGGCDGERGPNTMLRRTRRGNDADPMGRQRGGGTEPNSTVDRGLTVSHLGAPRHAIGLIGHADNAKSNPCVSAVHKAALYS
jgi:hypothetical protein